MPLTEDKISRSAYENSSVIENAASCLDSRYAGIICDKHGNILFANDRAKAKKFKDSISSVYGLIPSADEDAIQRILSDGSREAYEILSGEHLLFFPVGKDLRGVIHINLSAKSFEDLLSLLRASIQTLGVIEHTLSDKSKSGERLRSTVTCRMERIMQLLELSELPQKPYSEIACDLSELTKMLCGYASHTLSEFTGEVCLDTAAAVFSRINPELYAMLFTAASSLVMCQSEQTSISITLSVDEHDKNKCCIRFSGSGCSCGTRLYLNFLEYTCFKLGLDCSAISDKEQGLTEFSLFVETEATCGGHVQSSPLESDTYNIEKYLHLLSGRLFTRI